MNLKDKKIIAIVGPTAVGKTSFSIKLAKELGGEIINGDSVQVYKGLDIGSAKITQEEMNGIRHHLIDIKEPDQEYSVADFQRDCRMKIEEINERGKVAIIVGGSGLYISSVLYEYHFADLPNDDKGILKMTDYELQSIYNEKYQEYSNIDINNISRLKNFIYKMEYNMQLENDSSTPHYYNFIVIGINKPREELYQRINKRVDIMIEKGLVEEVEKFKREMPSQTAIGYKEVHSYLAGEIDYEEMIRLIKRNSRRFAKRQITWFNNQMDVNWIEPDKY